MPVLIVRFATRPEAQRDPFTLRHKSYRRLPSGQWDASSLIKLNALRLRIVTRHGRVGRLAGPGKRDVLASAGNDLEPPRLHFSVTLRLDGVRAVRQS